jgi:hypothetical protein
VYRNQYSTSATYHRHTSLDCEEYVVCYLGYGQVNACPPGYQLDTFTNKCSLPCSGKSTSCMHRYQAQCYTYISAGI